MFVYGLMQGFAPCCQYAGIFTKILCLFYCKLVLKVQVRFWLGDSCESRSLDRKVYSFLYVYVNIVFFRYTICQGIYPPEFCLRELHSAYRLIVYQVTLYF